MVIGVEYLKIEHRVPVHCYILIPMILDDPYCIIPYALDRIRIATKTLIFNFTDQLPYCIKDFTGYMSSDETLDIFQSPREDHPCKKVKHRAVCRSHDSLPYSPLNFQY